ncbi:2,3-dehydroadipyl-CoA hydratase [Aestuariivirga litoralis]|uniref:2,3-dehydroadipyl-CoA hydratase n=1 Tax=Aestuariivirga litoralis TaxID=2650924 RepID=A0A2W2BCS2_9HYPH|nr:enoyl-CoA hydratase-related protein [Aestuariivirga litoralis]PZF78024.1 2,3-dehydroadipyl-CoA hydratase [Aestuariivirga litoralis]
MDTLLIDRHDGWLRLTLNRPAARNALNTELLGQLAAALMGAAVNSSCRAVLLCGAEGNFAAGADIGEIEHKTRAEGAADPRKAHWQTIRDFRKPLIAAVDGFALGGGFELALMADLVIAGETARFGLPETSLGLIPGAGGGQRLLSLVGRARASRMVLTGEIIDAATAEAWGIAAWRCEGSAIPEGEKLAAKLAARAPLALQAAKRALVDGDDDPKALTLERSLFEKLLDSADKTEGIAAFREKRKPEFRGQ